jgi:RHS repeat-associated protein
MRVQSDVNPTGAVTWLHSDMLGSASLLTNANGSVVSQARYKPWGDTRSEWSVYLTDRKYTGQREESTLGGIYDYNARFYDPIVGRFLSPDTLVQNPSDPQSLNRFAYARNNPLKYVDPSGHCFEPVSAALCLIGGVALYMLAAQATLNHTYQSNPDIVGDAASAINSLLTTPLNVAPAAPNNTAGTTPNAQQPVVLANPNNLVGNANIVESYPLGSSSNSLQLTTPLAGSSTLQTTKLFARVYEASSKHSKGGHGTPMDLDDKTAQEVLDSGSQHGKQIYGYKDGSVYVFKKTGGDIWHGYKANEVKDVPSKYLKELLDNGSIDQKKYERLVKEIGGK